MQSVQKEIGVNRKKIFRSKFGGGDPCASGCGRLTTPQALFCEECQQSSKEAPPETDFDLDIYTEVLEEQMRGENFIQKKLEEMGTRPCGLCGRPSLPWRVYCSPSCHGRAPRVGPATFELHGIVDSLNGHAKRIGINKRTVRLRIQNLGMDPIEALITPVDKRPLIQRRWDKRRWHG